MKPIPIVLTMCAALSADVSNAATTNPVDAPYGSWRSPISAHMLVQGAVRFGDVAVDGETLYWVEGRPEEQGRYAIVRRTSDGKVADLLPSPSFVQRMNVRLLISLHHSPETHAMGQLDISFCASRQP